MKRVLVLLSNGFEVFEAAAFIDVLGWADAFGLERIETVTAGIRPQLKCTFGFQVVPDARLNALNLDEFDALAIPGGFEAAGFYEDAYAEEFLDAIRQFNRKHKLIASICVGALPVGKSGVLTGRPATTYHLLEGKRRQQLAQMGATIVDAPIVLDENVITSTSPATAVDVGFALLERLTSNENAEKIRTLMGFTRKGA